MQLSSEEKKIVKLLLEAELSNLQHEEGKILSAGRPSRQT